MYRDLNKLNEQTMEGTPLLTGLDNVTGTFCILLGLIYALSLKNPSKPFKFLKSFKVSWRDTQGKTYKYTNLA